ncbi:MAG: hypothetical protein IPI85_15500 [Dehalococcoidia bacterium]|nr:hypothetical protein [Dehalococcoidia bacterium]
MWVEGTIPPLEFALVIAPSVDRTWDFVGHGDTYHKVRVLNIESQTKSASTALDATVPYGYRADHHGHHADSLCYQV